MTPVRQGQHNARQQSMPALQLARSAHAGQTDLAGAPYTDHLERVWARLLKDPDLPTLQAGLLHDVLEDTHVTPAQLEDAGFVDAIPIVAVVTRQHDESYAEFIQRVLTFGDARAHRLKLADLMDNLSPARVALSPSRSRVARYLDAAEALIDALGTRARTVCWGDLVRRGTLDFHSGEALTGDARADRAAIERALVAACAKRQQHSLMR